MTQYIVIGTSPFHDTSIAAGPYRTSVKAADAALDLTAKGWNTETVPLSSTDDVGFVTNDEE